MDEGIGGGDREESKGSAVTGAGLHQQEEELRERTVDGDVDGEEGGGGGLAGGEGEVGGRGDAVAGGRDFRGGIGRRRGGGERRREKGEDDEGVGDCGSGEGCRVRPGLLSVEDESGRVRIRTRDGYLFDPFLLDESEELQGNGAVAAQELLAFGKPVAVIN